MKFAQMQEIATELGMPDGELAPVAGAGAWALYIPPFGFSTAVKAPSGKVFKSALQHLINPPQASPTIMEKWDFEIIRVPCWFLVEWAEVPATPAKVQLQLILRKGGDIVWSQIQEVEGRVVPATGELIQIGNVTFADNFQNPIELMRGRDLTMQLIGSWQGVKEAVQFKAQTSEIAESSTAFERNEGVLQYEITKLSGERSL